MKKYNFQEQVKELQKQEINSLHTELAEKEAAYRQEISDAGFENTHDYENHVSGRFAKKMIYLFLFMLAAFFVCNKASAQFYTGLGAGLSASKGKPMAELQIGFTDPSNLVVQAGFQAHLDNKNPVLLQGQVGYRFYSYPNIGWQLAGGYCKQLISNDDKSRNRSTYIASAQFFRPVGYMGEWYINASYTPGYVLVSIGMRGIIR